MPPKQLPKTKNANWIQLLSEEERKNFKLDGENIFCNVCSRLYNFKQKYQLDQHVTTTLHKESIKLASRTGQRQLLFSANSPNDEFNQDLSTAMIAARISWKKLENPYLKGFLEKHCKRKVPSESTLRKNYFQRNYDKAIDQMRLVATNQKVWLGVDETPDKKGRLIVNVMFGCLTGEPGQPHLLMSREVERANNTTITQLVVNALHFLWPGKQEADIEKQFIMFVSDAAPYMVKAVQNLKNMYRNLHHVTCLAHGLHRVAEMIRQNFDSVNTLLASVKAVFKKAPSRIRVYREMCPELDLPPKPVLTRWGTWLEAVEFYSKNFESIKSVVTSLDPGEAESIKKAQKMFERQDVKVQLAYVIANYTFIARRITELEARNLPLCDTISIIERVKLQLESCAVSSFGEKVLDKFNNVLQKNPDLNAMKNVSKVLRGETNVELQIDPSIIPSLKYCPLTSVELERGFSVEKALLSDQNQSLTMQHLEMKLISQYELGIDAKFAFE